MGLFNFGKPKDEILEAKLQKLTDDIEIKKVEVQGISKDYIKVEYRDGDYLYVPTDDLSNVRKFVGAARKCTKT